MEKLVLRVPEWQGELVFSEETLIFVGVILLMVVGSLFCFWGYKYFGTILLMGIGIATCYGCYLLVEPMTDNPVIIMFLTVSLTFLGLCFVYFLSIIWGFILDKMRIRTALAKRSYLLAAPVGAAILGLTIYYMIWRDEIVAGAIAAVCLVTGLIYQHSKRNKQVRFRSYNDLLRLSRPQFDADEGNAVAVAAAGMAAVAIAGSEYDEAGYEMSESAETGYEMPEYDEAGYEMSESVEADYEMPEYDEAGYEMSESVEAGYEMPEYDEAGYEMSESVEAGYEMAEFAVAEPECEMPDSVGAEYEIPQYSVMEVHKPELGYVSSSVYEPEHIRTAVYAAASEYAGSSVYEPEYTNSSAYESEPEYDDFAAFEPEYTESAVYQSDSEDVGLEVSEAESMRIPAAAVETDIMEKELSSEQIDSTADDSQSPVSAPDIHRAVVSHSSSGATAGQYNRKRYRRTDSRSAKDNSFSKIAGSAAVIAVGLGSFIVGRMSKGGED